MDWLIWFLQSFVPLFIIVNPLGAVPMFLMITKGDGQTSRKRAALVSGLTAGGAMLVAALAGQRLLSLFDVTVPAFQIAGGLILFSIAYEMLEVRTTRMKSTKEEVDEAVDQQQVGISPMGIPMLAGPGALTTTLAYAGQAADSTLRLTAVICAIFLVGVTCTLVLSAATRLQERLGRVFLGVVARLEGLLLATIAVQMLVTGLLAVFPGWGSAR